MSLRLAIILPTLNERDNLAPLIARIDAALPGVAWEAIVVDDDSADGTAEEARRIGRTDSRVRVIQRIGRRGLASAAIEGMCATAAPFVAVMDADHQHDPGLLPTMLAEVEGGHADVAVGSRYVAGASTDDWGEPQRKWLSGLLNRMVRMVLRDPLTDPLSGYFLLRADLARALSHRLSGIGFKLLLDILAATPEPLRVREFPLAFAARRAGQSKVEPAILLDFLAGLYNRWLGWLVPTRFALFGTVGAFGVMVHLAVLALLYPGLTGVFWQAQAAAILAAMTSNFFLNNVLTYRDRRLRGARGIVEGWLGFCLTCAVGALANVAVATLVEARGLHWLLAGMAGIMVGAVWNYALSSRFVWGRY